MRLKMALFSSGVAVAGALLLGRAWAQAPMARLLPPVPISEPNSSELIPVQDKKDIPTLPPSKVEGVPKTPTAPTPPQPLPAPLPGPAPEPVPNDFPSPPPESGANVPLTSGGVFGVPQVQGYRADSAISGTKVDSPLINYPGTLTVVPIDLIRDQQALSVDDILRNIPSAVKQTDFANLRDNFVLRGFEVASRDFRWNGFTDPSYVPRDFYNIQRVEVLTGPASVLYGAGSPSGLINFITKQPQATPYNNFQATFGSFNLSRYAIDSTGAIDSQGKMLYRIDAEYQNSNSFRDFGYSERTGVAPVFALALSDCTVLSVEGAYQNARRQLDTGVIFFNGSIQGPINRSFNEPTDQQKTDDYKSLFTLLHKFSDNWTGRIQFYNDDYRYTTSGTMPDTAATNTYNNVVVPQTNAGLAAFGFPPLFSPLGPTQILRDTEFTHLAEQFYDIRAELNGKLGGPLFKNNFVLGTEMGWYHSDFTSFQSDPGQGFNPLTLSPPTYVFNFAQPNYGQLAGVQLLPSSTAHIAQERFGSYVSDQIDLGQHWKVLAGVRYDIVDTDFANSFSGQQFGGAFGFPLTTQNRTDYHISPRVGIVFQPIPETVSLYATYTTSFDPPVTGIFATPTALMPETGVSYEIGVKADLFEKRLTVQAAGYYIDKHNVVAQENFITSTQIGEIRSSGLELSAVGKITCNWSIVANYSYCDSRIVSDPADEAIGATAPGDRFRGVPFNAANIWSRYNLIDNEFHTLGVGLGFVYTGARYGDLGDSFVLPGYTRWDAGLFYKRGHLNAALYLENLGDRNYYGGSFDANTITPGTPFNARVTMGLTF
jgi:iron complex outermembrane recepter protein